VSKQKKSENNFEESFKRLEKILEKPESDDCSLDETIVLYEEAEVTKLCYDKLTSAELRIKEINRNFKNELEIKDLKDEIGASSTFSKIQIRFRGNDKTKK
jgi:exodeoxyribonuclease VII small subunit